MGSGDDAGHVLEIDAVGPLDEERAAAARVLGVHLSGTLPPLLMIRTWTNEIDKLRALARELGPDQPIYSVAPPTGAVPEDFPKSVDEWSDFSLAQLDGIPHEGFPLIAGWSFGGVVALEVAQKLADKGEPIRLVVLIDSRYPKRHPNVKGKRKGLRKSTRLFTFSQHLSRYVLLETPEEKRAFLKERLARRLEKVQKKVVRAWKKLRGQSVQRERILPEKGADGEYAVGGRRMSLLEYTVRITYLKYRRDHCTLPVAQLWTQESLAAEQGDASLGWARRLRGEFETVPVPGRHDTMFDEPHVEGVARRLARALRRANA